MAWANKQIKVRVPVGLPTGQKATIVVTRTDSLSASYANFTVKAPPAPSISRIAPIRAYPGQTIAIYGTRFGATQGSGSVTIGGLNATVVHWSGAFIKVKVPASLARGVYAVTVTAADGQSATYAHFTVNAR